MRGRGGGGGGRALVLGAASSLVGVRALTLFCLFFFRFRCPSSVLADFHFKLLIRVPTWSHRLGTSALRRGPHVQAARGHSEPRNAESFVSSQGVWTWFRRTSFKLRFNLSNLGRHRFTAVLCGKCPTTCLQSKQAQALPVVDRMT